MRFLIWILAVIGGLFLLLFLALLGFGFAGFKKGYELAKSASAYADETIAAYGAAWDESVILDRASPELQAELSKNPGVVDQLSLMMDMQAGAFVSASPSVCADFTYNVTTADGEVFTATCVADSVVAKGTAQFTVSAVNRHEEWRLLGFYVNVTSNAEQPSTLVSYSSPGASGLGAEIRGRGISVSPTAISLRLSR